MTEYNESIIGKKRKGTYDDPFKNITETIQIINGKVVLTEIPNRFEKVRVTLAGTTMYEIEDGELNDTLYKVDYTEGVVFFNSTHNNKSCTFSYQGEGVHFFPSSSIWITNDTNGIQTAKEKFDRLDLDILAQKKRVDNQIASSPQPNEILDLRVDRNGVAYSVTKDRIDAEQKKIEDAYKGKDGTNYTSLKDRFDKTDDKIEDLEASFLQLPTKADLNSAVITKVDKTYVDNQISNIGNASPKGTYATLAALQTAFPIGATGIYVVTADGNWYYWNETAWTSGGVYQGTGIASKAVSFLQLDDKLVANQLKRFTIYNSSVSSLFTHEMLSGVKYLKLHGFDKTVPHRLRCLARNHLSFKYRIIISALQGGTWVDVFDTGTGFTVTENANGFTKLDITLGAKRVVIVVDYPNTMGVGVSISDPDLTKTKYTLSEECFLEDVVVPSKSVSISQLDDKLANSQLKYFAISDSTATSLFDVGKLSAVKYLKLYGFDETKRHKLRVLARNHSSFRYRFIITQETSAGVWTDVFDATSSFTITENANGYTKIDHTIGSKRVVMLVDYPSFANTGDSIADTSLTNAKYIILDDCFKEVITASSTQQTSQKKMIATKTGTTMKVKFRYNDTQNMIIEFGLLGINAIAHMRGIYLENSNILTDSFTNLVTLQSVATDWVSPYGLVALNNPVNDFLGTVGGNHGTDSGAGFPTARREEVKFYADNMLMQDDKIYYCDEVVVKAIHYVSASNTIDLTTGSKRDSVKEFVAYTITPQNMEVSVSLTALENVKFTRYTGLQAQVTAWNDEGYFMLDKTPTSYLSIGSTTNNSAKKTEAITDRFIAKKGEDYLIGYMNRRVGIGNRDYIGDTYPNAFFSNNGKVYMPCVNGTEMTVNTGESVSWNGGWTFTPKLNCDNAKAAYFINNLGKRVYCVDFFNAGVGYLDVLPEDYNKEIEVVYKDSTITCDTFTISKGLKVQSTGYGQLKFTIK
jgi:hypothetical protein